MTGPLVSVVVITHGQHRPFLRDALESVHRQDYRPFEVVVADNGGSDLGDLAHEFPDVRFLDARAAARCAGAPRNVAVPHTTGDLIAFLDHDDTWAPDKLTRQVGLFAAHPEIGLSFTQFELYDDATGAIRRGYGTLPTYLGLLAGEITNYPSSLMVRRALFERLGGFSEDVRIAEDVDFTIRACAVARAGFVDEVLLRHRDHATNMTADWRMPYDGGSLALLRAQRRAAELGDALAVRMARHGRRAIRSTYGRLAYDSFRAAVRSHDWSAATSELHWSLRLDPRGTTDALWRHLREAAVVNG